MKDRQPLHAGRVQLVPVAGQTNIYDMTMADDATEQGTALNKANLLKDATAALFGLDGNAVPDDVLAWIGTNATRVETGTYIGTGVYGSANKTSVTFSIVPKLVIVGATGTGLNPAQNGWRESFIWSVGVTSIRRQTSTSARTNFSISGKTLSWYSSLNTADQENANGVEYTYVCIG